tara:strand:- start:2375 stop:2698 length:324 start_codon:yes stop_codon:yes gene_type:complete
MIKFLKVTVAGADNLIPLDQILAPTTGGTGRIVINTKNVGFKATGGSQTLNFRITATGVNETALLNSFVDLMAQAYSTSWKEPIFDITNRLPGTPTGFDRTDSRYVS